jgi:hypothetical protein
VERKNCVSQPTIIMSFTYISDSKTRRDSEARSHRPVLGREESEEPKAFKTALAGALLAGYFAHKASKGDKLSTVAAAAIGALAARETKRHAKKPGTASFLS